MTDTSALWSAVDALTKPTTMRIHRDATEADLAAELLRDLAENPRRTVCTVAEYRAATERGARLAQAQTSGHGTIPSLWDQAAAAVGGTGDASEGGAGPARERSPADLALMETLYTLRDTILAELADHGRAPRDTVPAQIRQVASILAADGDPDTLTWWSWRFEQWSRIIGNQINAVDNGPKPFRLRGSACPACGVRQVRVHERGEWRMVPPLQITFRHGAVRAAECSNPECAVSWFRGEALNELADTLGMGVLAREA